MTTGDLSMNMRRITSLTLFISFFVIVITSIILYIAPQGRVAYWVDWRLFALSKDQWGAIHINLGFLFLIALIFHIYYNWKPMVQYMKNKARELKVFTREFNIALLLTLLVILGTYAEIPPLSTVIHIGDGFKDRAARIYGEPPYGHAELSSLDIFSKKVGVDVKTAMTNLESAGFKVEGPTQTLKDMADINQVTPRQLYEVIRPETGESGDGKLPESPPPGTGNLTLAALCDSYGLDTRATLAHLQSRGIKAEEAMTLKKIAQANGMGPLDVYERIRESVQ